MERYGENSHWKFPQKHVIITTDMKKQKLLPVKSDIVFRMFFADERNEDFLISFLKSVLKLPKEEYKKIVIADPHLLPEHIGDKFSVIDVKLHTKSGKTIHIEIQLQVTKDTRDRIVFYDAKLITEQLGSGGKYESIQKVISIVITNKELIKNSSRYHHRFTFYDPEAGVEFSDVIEIHSLELNKLPDRTDGTELYDWAKFINAESEEELDMVAERNPRVKKAVVTLRRLSADEQARDMYERREKAMRDIDSMNREAEQRGLEKGKTEEKAKIATNLLSLNLPLETIITATGLTREEIENLRKK